VLKTVDRYVLLQILKPLGTAMAIGLLMLLAERMVRLLETTLGKKNSFSMVFELLAYLVPHYLGIAIPAALFLGLLFGFNRLSRDSEIDALMSVGAGLVRLTRPVMLLSAIFAVASLLIVGWLQPVTRYAYRSALFDVGNVEVFYLAQEGVFMQAGSRTFILDELDRSNNSFSHVFLFDDKGPDGSETMTASSGQLIALPQERRPVLRLNNGNRLNVESWPLVNGGSPPAASIGTFDQVDAPLGKIADKAFRPRGDDERELTLPELLTLQNAPPAGATTASMRAELHKRVVNVATLWILPLLAVPFAIGRQRSQRSYRFGIALVLVVALHEIIEQGALMTKAHGTTPWLSMWLPLAGFTAFAVWRFYSAAYRLQQDNVGAFIDAFSNAVERLMSPITRRFSEGGSQ
jgi:lipopolysaccharide export system permease protein